MVVNVIRVGLIPRRRISSNTAPQGSMYPLSHNAVTNRLNSLSRTAYKAHDLVADSSCNISSILPLLANNNNSLAWGLT